MHEWNTTIHAVLFDSSLAEVFGPLGIAAFLAVAGSLFGATLAVLVRDLAEQIRARATRQRRSDEGSSPSESPQAA